MNKQTFFFSVLFLLNFVSLAEARTFGNAGYDGRRGAPGRPGRSGQDQTITVSGGGGNYVLSGEDGENGYFGEEGRDANFCIQPGNVSTNLNGARGGDGGAGGNGGNGGRSGSFTVHYKNLTDLQSIFVRATPGRGGVGAFGRRGGRGCRCTTSSWKVTSGEVTKTYYCRNGAFGRDGWNGDMGARGNYGEVTLIGQTTALEPTQEEATIKMEDLEKTVVELATNLWDTKTGARSLFAAGSDLNDTYRFFLGRHEINYGFAWKAPRPLSDFAGKSVVVRLVNAKAQVNLPDLWVHGEEVSEEGGITYVIQSAIFPSEATQLTLHSAAGAGTNLEVKVTDKAGVSDSVQTEFTLTYYTVSGAYYYKRYNGVLPADAVTYTGNGFTLALGTLPIPNQFLVPGTRSRIQITAKRSVGVNSTSKSMELNYTLN